MADASVSTVTVDPLSSTSSLSRSSLRVDKEDRDEESPYEDATSSLTIKKIDKKKRSLSPFSHIFSTSHKKKNVELHKKFTTLPESEKLIDDFSCALNRDILIQGRLYVTQNWLCFYANIFSFETVLTVSFQDVQTVTKEKTARIIPNAIHITTAEEKHAFSSLARRDAAHAIIVKVWENSSLPEPLGPFELVQTIKEMQGESKDVGSEDSLWGHLHRKKKGKKHKQSSLEDATDSSFTVTSLVRNTNSVWLEGGAEAGASLDINAPGTGDNLGGPSALTASRPSEGEEAMLDSDSTDDEVEVSCGCAKHHDKTLLNEVYNTKVETVFQLLQTDSDLIRNVFKARKATALEIGEWQTQPDGSKKKDTNYTLELNLSFGPKFSTSDEHFTCSKDCQPNLKYIIDSEIVTTNIPYSDTFSVFCRCCITRVSANKTRVLVTAKVNFKKSCWGLIKNLIEKNSNDGMTSHYKVLDTLLKEHLAAKQKAARRLSTVARLASLSSAPMMTPPSSPRDLAPRGRPSVTVPAVGVGIEASAEKKQGFSYRPLPHVNLALTLLLGLLIVSNMVLYHYLMSYQTPSLSPAATPPPATLPLAATQLPLQRGEWLNLKMEWISLVRQQLEGHDKERQQWYKTLTGIVEALDQIEATVSTAKTLLVTQLEACENEHNEATEKSQKSEEQVSPQAKKEL